MRTYKMISRSTTTPSSVNPLTKKESVSEELEVEAFYCFTKNKVMQFEISMGSLEFGSHKDNEYW